MHKSQSHSLSSHHTSYASENPLQCAPRTWIFSLLSLLATVQVLAIFTSSFLHVYHNLKCSSCLYVLSSVLSTKCQNEYMTWGKQKWLVCMQEAEEPRRRKPQTLFPTLPALQTYWQKWLKSHDREIEAGPQHQEDQRLNSWALVSDCLNLNHTSTIYHWVTLNFSLLCFLLCKVGVTRGSSLGMISHE